MRVNVLLIFLVVFLTGCANISTVQSQSSVFDGKTVLLKPTGKVNIESVSNNTGGAFGIVGFLIEQAATENARNQDVKIISSAVDPFAISTQKLTENIKKFGNIKSLEFHPVTLGSENFTDWFNGDTRRDVLNNNTKSDMYIDYGFQGLNTTSNIYGTYAGGVFGLRVIDAKTGKVIARVRTYGSGTSGVKILAAKNSPDYSSSVAAAFKELIEKITIEAIDKVTQ